MKMYFLFYALSNTAKSKCFLIIFRKKIMLAVKFLSVFPFCPFFCYKRLISQVMLGRFIHKLSLKVWAIGLYDTAADDIVHNIDNFLDMWQKRGMFS